MDEVLKDKRFAHLVKDPRFRRIPKHERKIKIDKRFQSMFTDKNFSVKFTVDKRGRPVNETSVENLRKYYDLSSAEEAEDDNILTKEKKISAKKIVRNTDISNEDDMRTKCFEKENSEFSTSDSEEEIDNSKNLNLIENEKQLKLKREDENRKITENVKQKLKNLNIDYARGEGFLLSDSSSDEETSDYEDYETDIEHNWGELDKEAERTDEITNRLCICNMDWDHIRAVDLMVLFNSFVPSGGSIHSITIYPSAYGEQRMKEEDMKGPIELVEQKDNDKEEENQNESEAEYGSTYHMEKLRQYQLNRLKYFYAVMVCDSLKTANKIYTECDGLEYESTAMKLDLRFIPNDMTFDQEPREICDALPDPKKYQPRLFTNTALQQVKVDLTWDEMDQNRIELAQKLNSGKMDDVDDKDLQAYLASGTSDEESDVQQKIEEIHEHNESESKKENLLQKYKNLLKNIKEEEEKRKNKDVELEFSWGLGVKENAEKHIKEKIKNDKDLTPFEKYCEKRKAKIKKKREEKAQRRAEESFEESDDCVPSDIDMSDPYFQDEIVKQTNSGKAKKRKFNRDDTNNESEEEHKKAVLELLMMDKDDTDNRKHFDMKKIEEEQTISKSKKKRLTKKNKSIVQDDFEVDVNDPRFAALFTSHRYNIDPSDPHYRKTKGTETLIQEKIKRRANAEKEMDIQQNDIQQTQSKNSKISALVKSVKRNSRNISTRIK